jgi:hypothetical protein
MPISPELWKQLRINAEEALKATGGPGVRLRGGPCDGWYVDDAAPMLLQPDWYEKMPEAEKWRSGPGFYQLMDEMERDARVAHWVEQVT